MTSITFTPTSLNPGSVITVGAGTTPVASGSASPQVTVPVGTTAIPVTVVSQDGTANATYTVTLMRDAPAAPPTPTLPQDGATSVPGQAVLSSTSGWANGLADGNFDLVINMWWGTDASVVVFYENGTEIGRQSLTSATPSAQSASLHISGKPNGSYVYSAALQNQAGTAKTADLTVAVTAANPGSPSVSNDNWDGDGSFTVSTDLWWGTNATEYTLFEDGQLVDTHSLTAATPSAQHASTLISGASIGDHVFTVELSNAAGATRSADMHVTVNK